jgi:fatty-acyl-CoA synthase
MTAAIPIPPEDAEFARAAWLRALELTGRFAREPLRTLPIVIDECAERFGDAPALISDEISYSHRQLAQRSHQYARWAAGQGLKRGDVVALVMDNSPDYFAAWLGLSRVGIIVSLINSQLRGNALKHALDVCTPRRILVGASLADELAASFAQSHPVVEPDWIGDAGRAHSIDVQLDAQDGAALETDRYPLPSLSDTALYIYTSGTTGLPKAARVSHARVMQWSHWFAGMLGTGPSDRSYNCLPMYHSIGGVAAVGAPLVNGGSVVVRARFSASQFWADVSRWQCTMFQYIGELARILLKQPESPDERTHQLRLVCGNGLAGDVWDRFRERFAIPRIVEFYAATEANFSLYNCEGRRGAIGRVPPFLAHRFGAVLVRFDVAAGTPLRDASGRCVRCATDEPGEAIARIGQGKGSPGVFEGYTRAADTEAKILRDVFEAGDAWFRSGDLMRRDAAGFYYFVDRIGDTFRWKGENVSTNEVSALIATCPGVEEVLVYGVAVPGQDGRSGMAALVTTPQFRLESLWNLLESGLPRYARPNFVRLVDAVELTGTFKLKKGELMQSGFADSGSPNAVLLRDAQAGAFVPLSGEMRARIAAGTWQF